jgi:hypothetical protein
MKLPIVGGDDAGGHAPADQSTFDAQTGSQIKSRLKS